MAKTRYQRLVERRARARAAGLCITCCTGRPIDGNSTCVTCSKKAYWRNVSRRNQLRRKMSSQHITKAHIQAGDEAYANHLYADAAQHYQDALHVQGITSNDHLQLSEKLAYALSLGDDPIAANPWFERALASYVNNPKEATKAVEILFQRARQFWIDARTESALPILRQAIQIAESNGDSHLRKLANSKMANYLLALARVEEAEMHLRAAGEITSDDDALTRATLYQQQGILAAVLGNTDKAFDYFDRAVSAAKKDTEVFHVTNMWTAYGFWAIALGRIERAKSCYERALLVARQHHIVWRIPDICLEYANVLHLTGQYGLAYEYLLNALAYDSYAPHTDTLFSEVGIPLALHLKDEETLTKCTRPATLEFAFRSGHPYAIGYVAGAFAEWYAASDHRQTAQAVLHRAIRTFRNVKHFGQIWALPIAVARFGAASDMRPARHLIERRTALPSADVANACASLFDAFTAQRRRQRSEAQRCASEAVKRFEMLGWHGYANLARTLVQTGRGTPVVVTDDKPFAELLPTLTLREQQVAELVLKGLTNRAIANALSIKERTVETHMTSIMSHLGVRSRHQLVDHLVYTDDS